MKEEFEMEQEEKCTVREIISMEEYLTRRQKRREDENLNGGIEKSPAWALAELLFV